MIERAALLVTTPIISARDLALPDVCESPPPQHRRTDGELRPATTERDRLLEALHDANWNLSATAARLEIPRNTLRYRMERHGLRPPPPSRQRTARSGVEPPPRAWSGERASHDHLPLGHERSLPAAVRWERRRVSLLRVDLAIGPASTFEPDMSRALQALAEKLQSFGGRIEEAALTQVVAAFGVTPMEDAPRHAALAAMAIGKAADRVRRTAASRGAVKLAIDVADCLVGQIGGIAVIDADSKHQACSRLQSLIDAAEPDTVVVSEAASLALERRFELTPLRGHARGLGASYLLRGPERTGFGVRGRIMTFLGRQQESSLLESRLDSALRGHGHVVAIIGEAGIGKSRIVFEFRQRFATPPITYLEGRCSSHATAVPYAPVLDIVRQLCGIAESDDEEAIETKVRDALERLGTVEHATVPYLLYLLGVERAELRDVTPEALKARAVDAIRQTIAAAARLQP